MSGRVLVWALQSSEQNIHYNGTVSNGAGYLCLSAARGMGKASPAKQPGKRKAQSCFVKSVETSDIMRKNESWADSEHCNVCLSLKNHLFYEARAARH